MSIFASIVLLCQNVYFFFTVSLDGAHVGEEAEKGMEMLRRHALKPTSNVHRKYLVPKIKKGCIQLEILFQLLQFKMLSGLQSRLYLQSKNHIVGWTLFQY